MRRPDGGFTLMEVMVSLVVLAIGMLGIMALQATTVRGNRMSRELERARVYAAAIMEDLRGRDLTGLSGDTQLDDVTTVDGVTYHRKYTVAASGGANLKLLTVEVSFAENGQTSETHKATLQMLRTTMEKL